MTKASDNIFPKVILDGVTSAPAAPSNDNWKIYAGMDGIYARSSNTIVGPFGAAAITVQDEGTPLSTGASTLNFVGSGVAATGTGATKTITISGSGQGLKDFGFAGRTSANITANSTSWANLDTGIDITLTAASGDIIEVGCSGRWGSEATNGILDVATIVSASPVNYVSGGAGGASHFGILAWSCTTGVEQGIGGSHMYTLVSGDVSGGNVLLRLRYRTSSATNKTFYASANLPFHWWAKNLGTAL